tara:strand:- start:79 stop:303 length:225 start_codon:yes stop_codon:yes gene_type:complete
MSIKDKIQEISKKYKRKCDVFSKYDLVVMKASYSENNPTLSPDEAIGYADWSSSSEVLIVLAELLDFIKEDSNG